MSDSNLEQYQEDYQETFREKLKPCPFCGAGEFSLQENLMWTGMRNVILSVEIYHWCDDKNPIGSFLKIRSDTPEGAIAKWNRRS